MQMKIVTFGHSLNSSLEQKPWNYLQNRDEAIKIIVFTSPPGSLIADLLNVTSTHWTKKMLAVSASVFCCL